jgi:hypothetical protein
MFKFENQIFLLTYSGRLFFMSASTAAAVADATMNPYFHQQISVNPYTQNPDRTTTRISFFSKIGAQSLHLLAAKV